MEEQHATEVRQTSRREGDANVYRETRSSVDRAPGNVVARRIVQYITGFIITLLALRLLLLLLGANETNAFVNFIYNLSGFFAAPFYGIFSYQPVYGSSVFEVSTLVAIIIYALIGWGIAKLFTLGSNHPAA